MHFRTTYI